MLSSPTDSSCLDVNIYRTSGTASFVPSDLVTFCCWVIFDNMIKKKEHVVQALEVIPSSDLQHISSNSCCSKHVLANVFPGLQKYTRPQVFASFVVSDRVICSCWVIFDRMVKKKNISLM